MNLVRTALFVALCLFQAGCRGGAKGSHGSTGVTEESRAQSSEMVVDAYLFDAKVREGGHLRSVRLQIYFADTIALITAKGYLGKGVGKGIWRSDSTLFYFPTENEFYSGPLDRLTRLDCLDEMGLKKLQQWLPDLLSTDPDRIEAIGGLKIHEQSNKEIKATLIAGDCANPLELEFNSPKKNNYYYLRSIEYRSAENKKLFGATRRTLKAQSDVSPKKFLLNIPADAQRITLD